MVRVKGNGEETPKVADQVNDSPDTQDAYRASKALSRAIIALTKEFLRLNRATGYIIKDDEIQITIRADRELK